MLYNDHSSTELEQQLRIEELTRERDEARAEVQRLTDASTHWQVMLKHEMEEVEWLKRAYEHIRKIHLFPEEP